MTDEHANVIRLLKYVGPVFTFAILFNIPKFFEATVKFNEKSEDPDKPHLAVTDFRLNPDYAIYYNNWTRLAILGIIPAVLLIFFNAKIYQDIRVSTFSSEYLDKFLLYVNLHGLNQQFLNIWLITLFRRERLDDVLRTLNLRRRDSPPTEVVIQLNRQL